MGNRLESCSIGPDCPLKTFGGTAQTHCVTERKSSKCFRHIEVFAETHPLVGEIYFLVFKSCWDCKQRKHRSF